MPHDWRDSLRLAADVALLGTVVTLLSFPLVTAGAAVATGSYAIHHLTTEGRWPSLADCWQAFRARLVPGLAAGPVVLVAGTLIVLDVAGLRRGAVPGGGPALVAVLTAAALAAGYAGLVAVLAGRRKRGAAREALALAFGRPLAAVAAAAVLVVAALLAVLVHPALVPVLAGYALFALHAVARRLLAGTPAPLARTPRRSQAPPRRSQAPPRRSQAPRAARSHAARKPPGQVTGARRPASPPWPATARTEGR